MVAYAFKHTEEPTASTTHARTARAPHGNSSPHVRMETGRLTPKEWKAIAIGGIAALGAAVTVVAGLHVFAGPPEAPAPPTEQVPVTPPTPVVPPTVEQ